MAIAGAMRIDLRGDKALLRAFEELPIRVQRRVLRGAIAKAARPIVKAAKQKAPRRSRRKDEEGKVIGPTGLLRKSLGQITRTYAARGQITVLVGARRGFKQMIGGKPRDPANYAHLIEFGHRIAVGGTLDRVGPGPKKRRKPKKAATGRSAGFVPAQPFLRPAYDGNESGSEKLLKTAIAAGVEREAAKLGRK